MEYGNNFRMIKDLFHPVRVVAQAGGLLMDDRLRKSGIDIVGDIPWGTHFCQFYQTQADLIDILVSYFKAGLDGNEFCMWITAHPLTEKEAEAAMRNAVPDFDRYLERGQIEIVPYTEWYLKEGVFDSRRVLDGWVEKLAGATRRGFSGLRLTGNTFWLERNGWGDFLRYEDEVNTVIGNYRMVALCTYSLDRCGASEIIDVVNTHQFALAKRAGKWDLIESAEHKRAEDAMRESERRYRGLFEHMHEGFAYCRVLFEDGAARDFVYLSVNHAFEPLTGLRDVVGRKVSEVIPGIRESDPELFELYGRVALTGYPEKTEMYVSALARWFSISVYCPEREHVVVVFDDITTRRRAEEDIRRRVAILDGINRIFREALACETEEELGRFCLTIAERMTGSAFGFIAKIGTDGLLHDIAISDPGWELCTMHDKTGHRRAPVSFKVNGLYGRVVLDRRTFCTNTPGSHPDRIGTPEGHPPLSAFLGAPLIHGGTVIGMVGLGNREGGYRAEEMEILDSLAGAITQVLVNKRAEEALRASLTEKDVLMRELAHRTKNNMQVVSSLIGMQAVATSDRNLIGALTDTQDRIRAMALVHEKLYRSPSLSSVNMREYATDLVKALLHAHAVADGSVALSLDLESLAFPIDAALHCGLIINELISNSLKYAFPQGKRGTIFLALRRVGNETELNYRDDGPGLPRDLDLSRSRSLGLKLVYNLAVRQLRGSMDVRRDPATEFVFRFQDFSHLERR